MRDRPVAEHAHLTVLCALPSSAGLRRREIGGSRLRRFSQGDERLDVTGTSARADLPAAQLTVHARRLTERTHFDRMSGVMESSYGER
jgi:hypothetical protein